MKLERDRGEGFHRGLYKDQWGHFRQVFTLEAISKKEAEAAELFRLNFSDSLETVEIASWPRGSHRFAIEFSVKVGYAQAFQTEFNAEFSAAEAEIKLARDTHKPAEYCRPPNKAAGYYARFPVQNSQLDNVITFLLDFQNAANNHDIGFIAVENDGDALYVGVGYAQEFEDKFNAEFSANEL